MLKNLKPIAMLPARERVASALRKAILTQELVAGEELTLESTAEKLGVSVTPVREAFQALARDGLILLRPNRGAIVKGIDPVIIRDHYETRAMIESEIVSKVCMCDADTSAIQNAYKAIVEQLEQENYHDYINYDYAFHYEIWKLCDNAKMRALAGQFWNSLTFEHSDTAKKFYLNSNREHGEILDAILEHDPQRGTHLMREHIKGCMEDVLSRKTEGLK